MINVKITSKLITLIIVDKSYFVLFLLFAKSQHFTGRILLRTGTNTQEGEYLNLLTGFNLHILPW